MATNIPKKPPVAPVKQPQHDDGNSVVMERRAQKLQPPSMYQVGKDLESATQIMLKIHLDGRGVCGVYTRDIAATKADQVLEAAYRAGHPLKCVSEPVDF